MFGFSGLKFGIMAIVAAAAVAAVGGFMLYVRHLSSENAKLTANNAVLQGSLASERAVREEIDRERVKADRIVADGIARGMERASALGSLKREIANAPPVKDGCSPWGPASDIVIRRLQQRADGSQAGTDPPEAAGRSSALRPDP